MCSVSIWADFVGSWPDASGNASPKDAHEKDISFGGSSNDGGNSARARILEFGGRLEQRERDYVLPNRDHAVRLRR